MNYFNEDSIEKNFNDSAVLISSCAESLAPDIFKALHKIIRSFHNGNKLLICGNGGSASDSQHFAAELVGRFNKDRDALPAICLNTDTSIITAVSNDYTYAEVFSRQVKALGNVGDILFVISTSGNSENILKAVIQAKKQGLHVVALLGKGGGKVRHLLSQNLDDTTICVNYNHTARIQEVHILTIHTICEGIDKIMFGL
jgi:D-sedoheptulose 7-phosphate isomerase